MKGFKYIFINIFVTIGVISSVLIAYAAWDDTATTGSSLTASMWNDMATAVNGAISTSNTNSGALANHL
jgi:hypothetical protein